MTLLLGLITGVALLQTFGVLGLWLRDRPRNLQPWLIGMVIGWAAYATWLGLRIELKGKKRTPMELKRMRAYSMVLERAIIEAICGRR